MIAWTLQSLDGLSSVELYEVLALRQLVFVVEQRSAYLDCDGRDLWALHLLGRDEGEALVAYARLLPPGVPFAEASFGRVVTHPKVRRSGLGRSLVRETIERSHAAFGGPIRIAAQLHLERLYAGFGFARSGEPYDEGGIPHVQMLLAG